MSLVKLLASKEAKKREIDKKLQQDVYAPLVLGGASFEVTPEVVSLMQAFLNSSEPSIEWRTADNSIVVVTKELGAQITDAFIQRSQTLRQAAWHKKNLMQALETEEAVLAVEA